MQTEIKKPKVRVFGDIADILRQRGFLVAPTISASGRPFTVLKHNDLDLNKNVLFVSRDYYGLVPGGEEKTLIPCKAPGLEIISNIMRRNNIGKASVVALYDVYDWSETSVQAKIDCKDLSKTVAVKVLTPAEKINCLNAFFANLPKLVESKQFTAVVFCDSYHDIDLQTGNLNRDVNRWGRVWQEYGVPCTLSVPLNYIAIDRDNDEATGMASLAGFLNDHTANVLRGYNRYTLDLQDTKCTLIKNRQQFDKFMDILRNTQVSCWDTETTGLSRLHEDVITIQVATGPKRSFIIPYKHKQSPFYGDDLVYIANTLQHYFEYECKGHTHIFHNAKYDLLQLKHMTGWRYYSATIYDTIAGAFAINENRKFLGSFGFHPYSLMFLTYNYGAGYVYEQGAVGKQDRDDLKDRDLVDVAEYGAKDVYIPYQIRQFQIDEATQKGDKNFERTVTRVIGDIIYDTTILESNGEKIDKAYLLSLLGKDSAFSKQLQNLADIINKSKEAEIANDIICERAGFKQTSAGLFGSKRWLLDLGKPEHKKVLFCDVLGLEADKTDKGSESIGKAFKIKYKDNEIVNSFDRLEKAKKARNAFIETHYLRFKTDPDLRADSRLRSTYQFQGVVTGRISASNPNMQQMPSHGEFCKLVKRQFIANPDHFFMKADYSAHEVRNWGNVAHDAMVCKAFDAGKQLRKELRYYFQNDDEIFARYEDWREQQKWKELTYEQKQQLVDSIADDKKFHKICSLMFDLENKGDVHKLNYEFFCGVPASKVTPVQRQSAKGLVFGTIYGRGPASIAQEIHVTKEEAAALEEKMFEKFEQGGKWLVDCKKNGAQDYYVVSPLGRIRHLDSYMNGSPQTVAGTSRQAPNSCIQGCASDIGFASGKIVQDILWNWFVKHGVDLDWKYCNVVHDSTETEVSLAHLPIALYLVEHCYTTLVHRKLKDVYGFDLVCGFEVESDIGTTMQHMETLTSFVKFKKYVIDCIEWSKTGFPDWSYNPESLEKCFHNYDILTQVRKRELKQSKGCKVDTYMELNEDNILKIGLEF